MKQTIYTLKGEVILILPQLHRRSDQYMVLKGKLDDVELLLSKLETKLSALSGSKLISREYTFKVSIIKVLKCTRY